MSRLPSLLAVLALVACESNLITNEPLPHVDAGLFGDAAKPVSRRDAAAANDEQPEDEEPEDEEPGGERPPPEQDQDAGAEPGDQDSDEPGEADSGANEESPAESVIQGSGLAANCASYATAEDGMCAGYYCAVTLDDLASEFKPGGKCDSTPARICDGQLTRDVAKCTRDIKSNPLNALDSSEQIRAKTQECVYKLPANKNTSEECLACFLDAAQCASENCLTQCLTGDSATCDKCRLANNCNQPVPPCAGFPTPF